jgi:signal transduction histidine kinase
MLFLTNLGILVSSGALAYFLAGRTLKPIQDMVDDQHRFVSDASHELKTPLTSLKSAFEVFLRDKKRTLKDADTIISESIFEVDKLQSLSESLLRLSQYQTTGKSLSFTSVQLGEVINTAIRRISPQAKIKNIEISSPLTAVSLTGDMSALTELMVILLDNAVKYSPNGKTVKIDTHSDSRWVKVTVADQGSGIPAADLPRIFDRFYRSDSARSKTDKGGYGLGLAIAKNIAAAHHGSIAVVSRLGQGSAFTVRIPLHPPFSTISVIAPKLHSHVA